MTSFSKENFRVLNKEDIRELNETLKKKSTMDVLRTLTNLFPERITLACSFGAEDVVLVDMLAKLQQPPIDMFYLDTQLLFKETYETRDRLAKKYHVNFIRVEPELSVPQQAKKYGEKLWESNPDLCCHMRKVAPLKKVLLNYEAWITGIRRKQSPFRARAQLLEWDTAFGLVKVNPLIHWHWDDVWDYIKAHDVPYNPLHEQNYPSIGCWPCTRAVQPGEDMRAGRWGHSSKTECGLHR